MGITLLKALRLSKIPRIAFVGAGGKTSALSILSQQLPKPLVVSTTTHLGTWQTGFADQHFILSDEPDWEIIEDNFSTGITLITQNPVRDRLQGLSIDQINRLYQICEDRQFPLLLECDGSRQLPLKAPGKNEPPIPQFVDTVVVVAGLTGLGKSLDEDTVYKPEIFSRLGNLPIGHTISLGTLGQVIVHQQGGLKNIPNNAKRILLLNQADQPRLQIQAGKLAKIVQSNFNSIIVAELSRNIVHTVFEPSAAIILAAGSSSRYGQTKQLLDYHGEPFIKAVTLSAINAGLNPIIVVTGADANAVNNALMDISSQINIIFNSNWQNGQSTSILAGIEALESNHNHQSLGGELAYLQENPGSVIFLLADQPQVTPMILKCLVQEHSRTLSPVIAPLIDGRRGNPVLFDKVTFPDLRNLEGDVGGRGIFSKHSPIYVKWNDISLLADVDNPADYERVFHD
ncbi:MAG: selenium cofactor biosynthesis protein YqeC [Chloroflexota bacterium]